jgi:hypothetical protein
VSSVQRLIKLDQWIHLLWLARCMCCTCFSFSIFFTSFDRLLQAEMSQALSCLHGYFT